MPLEFCPTWACRLDEPIRWAGAALWHHPTCGSCDSLGGLCALGGEHHWGYLGGQCPPYNFRRARRVVVVHLILCRVGADTFDRCIPCPASSPLNPLPLARLRLAAKRRGGIFVAVVSLWFTLFVAAILSVVSVPSVANITGGILVGNAHPTIFVVPVVSLWFT